MLFDNAGNIDKENEDGSNGPSTMEEETDADDYYYDERYEDGEDVVAYATEDCHPNCPV